LLTEVGDTGLTLKVKFGQLKSPLRCVQIAPDAERFLVANEKEKGKKEQITSNRARVITL
jgi:hypothetical protein